MFIFFVKSISRNFLEIDFTKKMKLIDRISFDKGPVPKMNGIFLRIYPPTLVDLMALGIFFQFYLAEKKNF